VGKALISSLDGHQTSLIHGIVASVIANVQQHDERQFTLTMRYLGISEGDLRRYVNHGDSVLLANLIHITRRLCGNAFRIDQDAQAGATFATRNKIHLKLSPSSLPSLLHFRSCLHILCAEAVY
jgi:hypothetical protein